MTTGQLLFYSGAALLGLTVLLAIIFIVKRPKYTPESAAYDDPGQGGTQRLRNGYPTDRLTVRREPIKQSVSETDVLSERTKLLAGTTAEPISTTEKLESTAKLAVQGTEKLTAETQHVSRETVPLPQGDSTEALGAETVSAPVIKCKKTPRKKCNYVAERREKR